MVARRCAIQSAGNPSGSPAAGVIYGTRQTDGNSAPGLHF